MCACMGLVRYAHVWVCGWDTKADKPNGSILWHHGPASIVSFVRQRNSHLINHLWLSWLQENQPNCWQDFLSTAIAVLPCCFSTLETKEEVGFLFCSFLLPTFVGLWDLTHSNTCGAAQLTSKSINPVEPCVWEAARRRRSTWIDHYRHNPQISLLLLLLPQRSQCECGAGIQHLFAMGKYLEHSVPSHAQ